MLKEFLKIYVDDMLLVALLLGSGLLVLLATRHIFRLDEPQTRDSLIPGQGRELVPQFLYMSHFAEDARRKLLFVVDFLRFALTFLLLYLATCFFIDAAFNLLAFLGVAKNEVRFWERGDYGKDFAHNLFRISAIFSIALIIYWSTEIIFHVVKAHEKYEDQKSYNLVP